MGYISRIVEEKSNFFVGGEEKKKRGIFITPISPSLKHIERPRYLFDSRASIAK